MELYGNVGPFELTESALNEFKAAEVAHKEAQANHELAMLKYKTDLELYEKDEAEYER
jgi:hypothetical protein